MLAFAYAECGLTVDQFFNLSFYEWSLEIYKVRKRQEKLREKWECDADFVRSIMAAIYNTAGKSYKKDFQGKDFIKLSFDKVETEENKEPLTAKGMKEMLGGKFKKDG